MLSISILVGSQLLRPSRRLKAFGALVVPRTGQDVFVLVAVGGVHRDVVWLGVARHQLFPVGFRVSRGLASYFANPLVKVPNPAHLVVRRRCRLASQSNV